MISNPFELLKYKATLKPADEKTMEQFRDVFPDFVIEEWKEHGFANYLNGLISTTDPNDYYEVMKDWDDDPTNCHVIMRSAFGSLYYLKNGNYYDRNVFHNLLSNLRDDLDLYIRYILTDKGTLKNILQKPIYDKAVKRLGQCAYDEVYAFVPAIALGGDYNPDTIQKVKLKEHLAFLAQLY